MDGVEILADGGGKQVQGQSPRQRGRDGLRRAQEAEAGKERVQFISLHLCSFWTNRAETVDQGKRKQGMKLCWAW